MYTKAFFHYFRATLTIFLMNDMTIRERAAAISALFAKEYPDVKCGLEAGDNAYRLLMMAILSAQCTDRRVNIISVPLFEKYPDIKAISECSLDELEQIVRPCGLYKAKAKNMKACCTMLESNFGGKIPSDMNALLTLPGVGRKIANLIRGDVFGLGGIVADTHMIRIANRLGFADNTDPRKVENALTPLIPTDEQSSFCHRAVHFGREICSARAPKCDFCFIREAGLCSGAAKQ